MPAAWVAIHAALRASHRLDGRYETPSVSAHPWQRISRGSCR